IAFSVDTQSLKNPPAAARFRFTTTLTLRLKPGILFIQLLQLAIRLQRNRRATTKRPVPGGRFILALLLETLDFELPLFLKDGLPLFIVRVLINLDDGGRGMIWRQQIAVQEQGRDNFAGLHGVLASDQLQIAGRKRMLWVQ